MSGSAPSPTPAASSAPKWLPVGQFILDIVTKTVTIVSIIVGGWWGYTQFYVQRTNAQTLQLSVVPKVLAEGLEKPFIIADVLLKNIGKVPVYAGEYGSHEGLELTVLEYDEDVKGIDDEHQLIDWNRTGNDDQATVIVDKYNMLGYYTAASNGAYVINPGIEFRETAAIPAKPGRLYCIRARFFGGEWTTADFAFVNVK